MPQTFALPGFCLKASAGAVFRARGRECRVSADGKGDTLRLVFRAEQTPDGFLLRLRAVNVGDQPVRLIRLENLRVERPEDLACGLEWAETRVMIQGRHKNDIPAIVTLGQRDENMLEAMGGLTESGLRVGESSGELLVSDTLTVLYGASGCLLIAHPEGVRDFCFTEISPAGGAPCLVSGSEPGVILNPGEAREGEPLLLRAGPDASVLIRDWAADKALRYGARRGRLKTPAVFCTWYYYGLTVSLEDVRSDLGQIREKRLPYDVFQLDEGWETTLGEWEPNARFPVSMRALAEEIRAAGLIPGIWTSPFIAHETASLWREHPDWRLTLPDGSPALFSMNGTVYQVLDVTNPAVRDWVRGFYRKLTADWGYRYHKLDFTRAAVLWPEARRFDPRLSLVEAWRLAMQAVREGIGEDGWLLVCGGLYDAAIGIADAQRTGSDVLSMWQSEGGGGKAVPCTVKQSLMRAHMSAWWANDADCLMLRRQERMTRGLKLTLGLLTDIEVRTVLVNQYVSCGLFSQTEPLAAIDADRLTELRHLLPLLPLEAEPALVPGEHIPSRVRLTGRDGLRELALFNWSDTDPLPLRLRPEEIAGPLPEGRYVLSAFYSRKWAAAALGSAVELGEIPPHGAEIVRLQPWDPARPVIVGSDGHFALGAEVNIGSPEDGVRLTPAAPLPFAAPLRVLTPEGREVCRVPDTPD